MAYTTFNEGFLDTVSNGINKARQFGNNIQNSFNTAKDSISNISNAFRHPIEYAKQKEVNDQKKQEYINNKIFKPQLSDIITNKTRYSNRVNTSRIAPNIQNHNTFI